MRAPQNSASTSQLGQAPLPGLLPPGCPESFGMEGPPCVTHCHVEVIDSTQRMLRAAGGSGGVMEAPASPSTSSPELMRIGTLFQAPLCSRLSPKGRAWVLLILGLVPWCQVRAAQVQPIRPFLYLPYLQIGWHPCTATNNPLGKCFPDAFQYYGERVPGESPLCCTKSSPIHPYNLPQASPSPSPGPLDLRVGLVLEPHRTVLRASSGLLRSGVTPGWTGGGPLKMLELTSNSQPYPHSLSCPLLFYF